MTFKRQVALVLDVTNTHHRKMIRGVASHAHKVGGWNLHLWHDPIANPVYLEQDPLAFRSKPSSWNVDGIIACLYRREMAKSIQKLKIPVIGIEPDWSWLKAVPHLPCFATDNQTIAQVAAEDLIARGYPRLAFCGVPRTRYTGWSEERQMAFQNRAREADLPCAVFTGEGMHGRPWPKVYGELLSWLKELEKPVGIMACYDVRALHVLEICQELGLVVPEEVGVIGVDNDEVLCELSNPPLSSVEQGSRGMGYQAAALLDRMMEGEKVPPLKSLVQPEGVVTRRSSDTWAIEDGEVVEAMRYIREHACEGIGVPDVLEAIQISRSTLDARFKAVIGRTIHAEIQRLQIERAKQLVATTDLPLKQVAQEAGFKYVQHFTTLFHQHTGQTPTQYRKHARG